MTIKAVLFIFISVIDRLKTIGANGARILKILLITGITFFRAYSHHQQLVLRFQIGIYINLAHGKLDSSLICRKLKPFLTNSLNPIGTRKLIGLVHFIHFNKNIVYNISLSHLNVFTLLSFSN